MKKSKSLPHHNFEYIFSRISYDPNTGEFYWKPRKIIKIQDKTWNAKFAYKQAGYIRKNGYRSIVIEKKEYMCGRLAWFLINKKWPKEEIDHINLNKIDDRISNLREATRFQNASNKFLQSNNTSGFRGVWKRKNLNSWCAEICKEGKRIKLGSFSSPEKAYEVYKKAAAKLHGEFTR